ncbi:MAG: NAD+ synthase, partial [Candidatus Latescibacterota bacterium]
MRVTMAQLNPIVGDVDGNVGAILDTLHIAASDNADLVVFPEMIVTGYPPKDLLEFPGFLSRVDDGLAKIKDASTNFPTLGIVLGAPTPTGLPDGKALYNTAFLIANGRVNSTQSKMLLPTYDVFDEPRYFRPAPDNDVTVFKNEKLGISVCEDFWNEPDPFNRRRYPRDPIEMLAKKGATLMVNISASPFSVGKEEVRYRLIRDHALAHGIGFISVNQVGGNDDLVFDGTSLFVDKNGDA